MVLPPHIKSGDLKISSGYYEGSNSDFRDNGDLAPWWAITYSGGTFDNLISKQSKFYIGMHYTYQLLCVECNQFIFYIEYVIFN